ncbi:imidazolonepropionase [Robertkochia marina]|uniref:Imidazolonepropionase n=1 Tax=Robertkochia marina TaxID=1227945 RepID=A0A4S3M098_9FLAO|nr:imidazolonepropionase [Robertkochia marina]THD67804.1 imidazolonepropionase [Robertkochia marina]TRZ41722.1 imidazolonepropionase [Robertkochia marina]
MRTLYINIGELLQIRDHSTTYLSGNEMNILPRLQDAFLLVENDTIADFGEMRYADAVSADRIIDLQGKFMLPAWIDSHTHLVYAGNREQEFVDRINGLTYEEIASKGGGILNSAKRLQETPEDDLYEQSKLRLEQVMAQGTGAIEIKSGYGLTPEAELKMLRVIKRLQADFPATIKATFLGAHAVPAAHKGNRDEYMNVVINEMLPAVAEEKLADFVDIFCEKGYFSVEDMERLLRASKKFDLKAKVHVNQFNITGGVPAAVKHNALSVDHLEIINEEDIAALKNSDTMPVALPLCSFFISIPYTPARRMIDAGLPLALASDYNPGTSPSGNMNLVIATACIKMNMTPEEAINAATVNAAYAMGLEATHGSITKGKKANLIITKSIPSYGYLPYDFGNTNIHQVILEGKEI